MNELVQRLSQGEHPVEASLRPQKTAASLKESIDRGYVHIKFTQTKGGLIWESGWLHKPLTGVRLTLLSQWGKFIWWEI